MPIAKKVKKYHEENKVNYSVKTHPVVYTAQELAAVEHIPGKELAKVVIVKADGEFIMTVLPASHKLDLERLKEILSKGKVGLATEDEFKDLFPQCEVGAMPPFGNLYDLPVYVDTSLTEDEEITFEAGTHHETITLKYKEFERLVKPEIKEFAQHL